MLAIREFNFTDGRTYSTDYFKRIPTTNSRSLYVIKYKNILRNKTIIQSMKNKNFLNQHMLVSSEYFERREDHYNKIQQR